CQLAPFGGVGDQFAHTRNSRFVDEIDDELEFVETFEVGKLRRIAGINERVETGANERACSSAKDCLLTKKIGLRLLTKSCLDYAGVRATDSLCPGQGGLLRMPAVILMNCNQTGRTAPSKKLATYHWPEAFRRHHDNVHISPGNDSAIMNREAMGKQQRLARSQIRRDLFRIDSRHLVVWERKKNDVSALRSSGCVQDIKTAAPGTDPGLASRIQADNHINPAVSEIESVCSTLCAEPNHCARFSLQPTEIGVFVGVNTRGQILLANAFGVTCLAYPRWNSLSQAPIYRHYPSVQRGIGESGGMTGAKTDRQRTGPGTKNFHFVAQTEARHPDG